MLIRSWRAEEVGLRSGSEDESIALVRLPACGLHCVRAQIDRDGLSQLHLDVGVSAQGAAQIKSSVAGGQGRCRYLVEQGLKLVIVVLINQCDTHIGTGCELACTVEPGKAATDDDYVLHLTATPGRSIAERRALQFMQVCR